jgi:hypothetical protein
MGCTKIVKRQQMLITSKRAFWQYQKQSRGFHMGMEGY